MRDRVHDRAMARSPLEPSDRGVVETSWARRIAAEVVGTFALVFVAAGGDTMARVSGGEIGVAARAVAPGLLVGAFILAIGDASGAHFNPVVSLGFALKRLFPVPWLPIYWACQLVGALGASALLRILFGDALAAGVSTAHVSGWSAVVVEAVLTWLLVTVVLGTADRSNLVGPNAAIAVGATIALCGLIAQPIEGASMNPARSLAPALVTGRLDDAWIYVLGPLAGTLVAVALTLLLHGARSDDRRAREAAQGSPSR
jgi:MIP family channel proteins